MDWPTTIFVGERNKYEPTKEGVRSFLSDQTGRPAAEIADDMLVKDIHPEVYTLLAAAVIAFRQPWITVRDTSKLTVGDFIRARCR